ncbi:unnamed protein product [Ixodes hexagonus]
MTEAVLTGFSSFLDWKRLTFQRPVPRAWTCDLCGFVSQTTVVTGCLHVFCVECHRGILSEASPRCPLDSMDINSKDTKEFVLGDAQRKQLQVSCPNAQHGCEFQGPLCDLENHYMKDCRSHVVACKACKDFVHRNRLVEHWRGCGFRDKGAGSCAKQSSAPQPDLKSDIVDNLKTVELTADDAGCTGDDEVKVLIETIQKCFHSVNNLADVAKSLVESAQHCVRATDDSANKTSRLFESVENCTEAVMNIQAICKKIPVSWLATCVQPNHFGINRYMFLCRNFTAKVAGVPADVSDGSHHYHVCSPVGNVTINGYQVKLSQTAYLSSFKKKCIAFKLASVGQAREFVLSRDITLILVHPTEPSLNKCRPLKSNELSQTGGCLKNFCFTADSLLEQGFVADDMLRLCLEAAE